MQRKGSRKMIKKTLIAQDVEEPSEKQFFTEGEDTKCEVAYQPYSGSHEDLFLREGDRIAVISPSSLPTREQTDAVVNGLKAWGYEPVEGKYVCVETRTLAEVMEDLEWALEDPRIRAVFCVRGGYGASEAADLLPPETIRKANKLIIGYSDITALHSAWTAGGIPSMDSTSGLLILPRNWRAYELRLSAKRLCPSAKRVSKARDDFPEPEMPVITTNFPRGISTVIFFRLLTLAPLIIILPRSAITKDRKCKFHYFD